MDYKECKFYQCGKCTHQDFPPQNAPPQNAGCIGKKACGCWHHPISSQYPAKPPEMKEATQ